MKQLVFFDLETSGLDWNKHEIIQIAAIATSLPGLDILDEFEVKLRFDTTKMDAYGRNRYNAVDWRTAVHPTKAKTMFANFLGKHSTKRLVGIHGGTYFYAYLAGHNINRFDINFLDTLYGNEERKYLQFGWDTLTVALGKNLFDGMDFPDLKLETLAQHFNLKQQTHDALDDVRLNIEVAKKLLEF